MIGLLSPRLLGRHVPRGSHHRSGFGVPDGWRARGVSTLQAWTDDTTTADRLRNKRDFSLSPLFLLVRCNVTVIQLLAMIFTLNPSSGQPLYLQLMQQIRHAIETGVLQPGDGLPGVRTLAQQLVISPNTVVKAYCELEHEGLLELRHGSGAYVSGRRAKKSRTDRLRQAQERVRALVEKLQRDGLSEEEIHRLVEAALFYPASTDRKQ